MNALVPSGGRQIIGANPNNLAILRARYPLLNTNEFNAFIHTVDHVALDPMRDQIIPMLFNANDPRKRKMVMVTTISGYRTIADRTGTYAPSQKETRVTYISGLKGKPANDPSNPANLLSVTVWLKKLSGGEWHTFPAKANWEEYAPITIDEYWDRDTEKYAVRKTLNATGLWKTMPEHMLTKCAHALACRTGWPDDYGGNLYDPAEIDRWKAIDLTPDEYARVGERKIIERTRSGPDLEIQWTQHMPSEMVAAGQLVERAKEFIRHHEQDDLAAVALFRDFNKRVLSGPFFAFGNNQYQELSKLFLPHEDRYHGRTGTYASRLAERQAARPAAPAKRPRQEFSSGTRTHIRHEDGRTEDIDYANDPGYERVL